jgi:hypothetical protein
MPAPGTATAISSRTPLTDTLDRYSAQRPHFVPWVVTKVFEQGEGFLLGFELREEAGSGHVAYPDGPSKSNSKSRFDECFTAGVGAIKRSERTACSVLARRQRAKDDATNACAV